MKDFLLINKPEGWTSFDVVAYVRKMAQASSVILSKAKDPLNTKTRDFSATPQNDKPKRIKVGHAGTLDPFATGLLIIGVGREATKRLDEFKNLPKTYLATIHLGATSNTDDKTGEITLVSENEPNKKTITSILKTFIGKQEQIPPMFSAKKIDGQRLYKMARKGEVVERQPSEIEIYSLKLLKYSYPMMIIEVSCSAGTYIRTLARDIGDKLKVGAYCEELTRTQIGDYNLADAKTITKALN